MKSFGSALRLQQDHVRAHQAVLHAVVVLKHPHFLNGVRIGSDGGLGHVAGVHVPGAIQRVEGAAQSHAIDRHDVTGIESPLVKGLAGRRIGYTGHQCRKALVIAPVQGKGLDLFLRNLA